MHVYERTFNKHGRAIHTIAEQHDLYDIVSIEPNDEMSQQTLLKAYICHYLAWGNAYIELQRDKGNDIVALWPRNPGKTKPRRFTVTQRLEPVPWRPFPVTIPAGTLAYVTTDGLEQQDISDPGARSGEQRIIPVEDMMHVPGMALDGRLGQSTVWLARNTLGLALATEKFGAKYFANFARPSGIVKAPMNLSENQKNQARVSWREAQGGENANMVAFLPPGWEWQAISNNPEEAQTIETRKYIRNEICAILHVPPHMVGDVDKGRANTEQLAQEFIQYCLAPVLGAIRKEWKRKIFPHRGLGRVPRNPYYVDFDLAFMLRPDAAAREKFYGTGRQWGYLNANDCRAFENLNPIDDPAAEEYWIPVNMTLTSTPIDPTFQDGAGNGEVPDDKKEPPDNKDDQDPTKPKSGTPAKKKTKSAKAEVVLNKLYFGLFEDGFKRILVHDKPDQSVFTRCLSPVLYAIRDATKQAAEMELRCQVRETKESDRFVMQYLLGMQRRSSEWDQSTNGEVTSEEFLRAIRAIRGVVMREAVSAKVQEETRELEETLEEEVPV